MWHKRGIVWSVWGAHAPSSAEMVLHGERMRAEAELEHARERREQLREQHLREREAEQARQTEEAARSKVARLSNVYRDLTR